MLEGVAALQQLQRPEGQKAEKLLLTAAVAGGALHLHFVLHLLPWEHSTLSQRKRSMKRSMAVKC